MLGWMLLTLAAADGRLTYFGDVRPMFEKSCYGCHAAGVKMGSLDLESWDGLKRGGNNGTIVVPGKPRESRLYTMLLGEAAPAMPMDGKVLPKSQIETVRQWIAEGAEPGTTASKPQVSRTYAMAVAGERLALGRFEAIELREGGRVVASGAGHADVVRALAVTRDGALIAAAGGTPGRQGEVKLWDAAGGLKLSATIAGHSDAIHAVAFSPDGRRLATGSGDKTIRLWDVAAGAAVHTLRGHSGAVNAVAFTPDGARLISGSADGIVTVWRVATGDRLYSLGEPAEGIQAMALAPDGKLLAAAGTDGEIRVWRLGEKGGELLRLRRAHTDRVLCLAWSPDGKTLASAGADQTVKWWRAGDLAEMRVVAGQPDWVYGLAFLPDGRLAAGRFDGSLTLYSK